jgi:hypothetical protein
MVKFYLADEVVAENRYLLDPSDVKFKGILDVSDLIADPPNPTSGRSGPPPSSNPVLPWPGTDTPACRRACSFARVAEATLPVMGDACFCDYREASRSSFRRTAISSRTTDFGNGRSTGKCSELLVIV